MSYEIILWATWAHEYMGIFVNIDGHGGVFKELEVCSFDNIYSACQ